MHQKQVPHFCAKCLPWSLRTSFHGRSDVPVRGNVPPFPRGPMSSTEASSVSVTHMQLNSRLGQGWGLKFVLCLRSTTTYDGLYADVAQRPQPTPFSSAGGGEDLIRNQLGRAEAQPSSEFNATEVGIQETPGMRFQVADQIWSSLKVKVVKGVKGFALRKHRKTALQLSTTAGRANFCLLCVTCVLKRTRRDQCHRLYSETLRRSVAQAFASRPSVGQKLVHCSVSKFSDVPPLSIYNQGPINLLINGLIVSSVGLFPR